MPGAGTGPPRSASPAVPSARRRPRSAAVRAASSAVSDARRSLATDPFDRHDGGRRHRQLLATTAVEPAQRAEPPVAVGADVDQTERLGDAAVGGDQCRDGSRTAVERVVAAQHPRAPDGERGEGRRRRRRCAGRVARRHVRRAARRAPWRRATLASAAGGPTVATVTNESAPRVAGERERNLEGGLVGSRHPGPAVVIVGRDPLPAHEHVHVRLKTTP